MTRLVFVWLTACLTAACTGEAPQTTRTPAPDMRVPPVTQSCERDADCTRGWQPTHNRCGPADRCFEGRCIVPPAMTGTPNPETGRVVLETSPSETEIQVEVADDRFEITRGLMCRERMMDNWGMLFVMEQRRQHSFWMKNTLIGLDIIFIDEDWTVVGVSAEAAPQTLSGRSVPGQSKYVLELKSGAAAVAGIREGTKARFFAPAPLEAEPR